MEMLVVNEDGEMTSERRTYGSLGDIIDEYPGIAAAVCWFASLTVSARLGNDEKKNLSEDEAKALQRQVVVRVMSDLRVTICGGGWCRCGWNSYI
jgi:hypothetical protein